MTEKHDLRVVGAEAPKWPQQSINDLINVAFAGRTITQPDRGVLKKLLLLWGVRCIDVKDEKTDEC
jgi:hypothetical protein